MRKPGQHEELARQGMWSLLDRGALDWVGSVRSLLSESVLAAAGSSWPADTVRALHLVSLYAPIWYRTWRDSGGVSTKAMGDQLGELSFRSELAFWMGLCHGGDSATDVPLFRLALGEQSPVRGLRRGEQPSQAWLGEYRTELASADWRRGPGWDLRVVCSIRFISFYMDWLHERDLNTANLPEPPLDVEWSSVTEALRTRCQGLDADVLWLIQTWLRSSWIERDSSGLPLLGAPRSNSSKLGLRAISEMSLLGE